MTIFCRRLLIDALFPPIFALKRPDPTNYEYMINGPNCCDSSRLLDVQTDPASSKLVDGRKLDVFVY